MIKWQRVCLGINAGKLEVGVGQSRGGLVSEMAAVALQDWGRLDLGGEGPILEAKRYRCFARGDVPCDLASRGREERGLRVELPWKQEVGPAPSAQP